MEILWYGKTRSVFATSKSQPAIKVQVTFLKVSPGIYSTVKAIQQHLQKYTNSFVVLAKQPQKTDESARRKPNRLTEAR